MSKSEPGEIVDERYWLARAATIVTESSEKLDQGARSIAAAMAWFWTVYSAAATASLAVAGREVTWLRALLVAAPALAIFAAYSLATWAALPLPVHFNVAAPYDIKQVHEDTIARKRRRLRWSFGFATVAALLVAAVVAAFALDGGTRAGEVAFAVSRGEGGGTEVVVGGRLPQEARVLVRVTPAGGPTAATVVATAKDRPFSLAIPVPAAASYEVQATWISGKRTTLLREVMDAP